MSARIALVKKDLMIAKICCMKEILRDTYW